MQIVIVSNYRACAATFTNAIQYYAPCNLTNRPPFQKSDLPSKNKLSLLKAVKMGHASPANMAEFSFQG